MTSLLLVEDHPMFAAALVRLLKQEPDLKVLLVVDTAEEALQVIPGLPLDLVLIDVSLPKMNGIELMAQINKIHPSLPCLMVSGHLSRQYLKRCLAAGARGYAIKDDPQGILDAIYQVIRGEMYISKELLTS
jgi:DNA-binding NarL/FixJ family response regulator